MTSWRQIMTPFSFWRFMANLHQSRNGIPDALSIILSFHYLTKAANRSKKFLTQAWFYWFKKRNWFFLKIVSLLQKKCYHRPNLAVSDTNKVYILKLNMCLHALTKFQVSNIILASFRQMVGEISSALFTTSKQGPKKSF